MVTNLRIGTIVQVKREPEILATLDEHGAFDGLPFTCEMQEFCGGTYKVRMILNRIHISGVGVRGIDDVVILEGVRCNGGAHGACGRACYLLFKGAWLNVLGKGKPISNISRTSGDLIDEPSFWKDGIQPCQGNGAALVKATKSLSSLNIRQYIHDLRVSTWKPRDIIWMLLFLLNRKWDARQPIWDLGMGNRSFGDLARMTFMVLGQTARWYLDSSWRATLRNAKSEPIVKPKIPSSQPLNLQPGELVKVKSREEILATLDSRENHKGLRFFGCMLNDCEKRLRVLSRVHSVVDEITGRQVKGIKNTVLLEDSICTGISYRGCPRLCFWLWREDWLKREVE
ncbi:MAG: hypothetical protein KAV87_42675 [Desulfobacteraceae bacterium]|nr:hypothetical protein [Desulfobacteraceae bacterium]